MFKFQAGDEVYFQTGTDFNIRQVSHCEEIDRRVMVWFTNGHWMPETALHHILKESNLLPEAPTEVRYECNQDPGEDFLEVINFCDHLFISIEMDGKKARIKLTAESALELSADLLRMALQIKRDSEESDE